MTLVLGTAGHIDHGKTSLIRALTGVDCDRLQEEKKRGITIELGFAEYVTARGERFSIIDVPGHEKFVHTMVSGATGIDFVLFVVAADEGIMPQTREHLEICSLLGITKGLVVVTKTDLVDAELLELALEDIALGLQGSFLEQAPVFPVSARTGAGFTELKTALDQLHSTQPPKHSTNILRLPIDRVFSMKGHGTVVTGTLLAGTLAVGKEIIIYPQGVRSKIRHLQHHGTTTENAPAGRRTAVNLQGLAVEDIQKGNVLAYPGSLFPKQKIIAYITCLPSSPRPLRQRTTVHLHHLTSTVQAQLFFPYTTKLQPGESAFCELRTNQPVTALYGDHCIIRSFSPLRTVAGGIIIHPLGIALRKFDILNPATAQWLEALSSPFLPEHNTPHETQPSFPKKNTLGETTQQNPPVKISTPEDIIRSGIESMSLAGATLAEIAVLCAMGDKPLEKTLGILATRQEIFCVDKETRRYFSATAIHVLSLACILELTLYHETHPDEAGLTRQELLSSWGKDLAPKTGHFILERLLQQNYLCATRETLHLPEHNPSFATESLRLYTAILTAHTSAGITPPNMKDVLETLKISPKTAAPLVRRLQEEKQLVKVAEGLWYAPEHLLHIRTCVLQWFTTHESIDLAGLKEVTGLSRKYLVALLEYFDSTRFTVRVNDVRILRNKEAL